MTEFPGTRASSQPVTKVLGTMACGARRLEVKLSSATTTAYHSIHD